MDAAIVSKLAKYQSSPPTISNEALFLNLVIDFKEVSYVATCDIPGSFFQTDRPEGADKFHINIDGAMVEIFAKINPQLYWK